MSKIKLENNRSIQKLILIIFTSLFIALHGNTLPPEVTIFDVGQGNCVAVKHGHEVMLFDAGSRESSYSKLYDELFGIGNQRYRFGDKAPSRREVDDDAHEEDEEVVKEGAAPDPTVSEEVDTETPPAPGYKDVLAEKICQKLLADTGDDNTLKAVVISHPDEDHYNLISTIFNEALKIETLVLGGDHASYSDGFREWVTAESSGGEPRINNVYYTGTSTGQVDGPIARPFSAGMGMSAEPYSDNEEAILKSLTFSGASVPVVEILAMNAGHSTTPSGVHYVANTDANTNSIVIRLKCGVDSSFLIPGDADECTWNFIRAVYGGNLEELRTPCVLLSHHGSGENGENSLEIMKFIKPRVCFISAGVHKGYKHPSRNIIFNMIDGSSGVSLDVWSNEIPEPLTYFKDGIRKRKSILHAIVSTVDWGDVSFSLKAGISLSRTRDRKYAYKVEETDKVFSRAKVSSKPSRFIRKRRFVSYKEFLKQLKKHTLFYKPAGSHDLLLRVKEGDSQYWVWDPKSKNATRIKIKTTH